MAPRSLSRVDPARLRSLTLAAALVGLLAGVVAATVAAVVAEPLIAEAIAIEEAAPPAGADAGAGGEGGGAAVSRADQRGVGLFGGYALIGAAFGAVLAVAAHGLRVGRPDAAGRVRLAGAVLAGAFTLAPWVAHPPNPPAVGDQVTLAERQWLYVAAVCLTLVVGVAAVELGQRLRHRGWPDHLRVPAVVLAVVVPLALALALLPAPPDVVGVPATLVWRFRLASLVTNLTLWAVLTLGLGALVGEAARARAAARTPHPVRSPA